MKTSKLPVTKKECDRSCYRRSAKQAILGLEPLVSAPENLPRRGKRQRDNSNCCKRRNQHEGNINYSILMTIGDITKKTSDGRPKLVSFSRHEKTGRHRIVVPPPSCGNAMDSLASLGNASSVPNEESFSWTRSGTTKLSGSTMISIHRSKRPTHDRNQFEFNQNNTNTKEFTGIGDSLLWCRNKELSTSTRQSKAPLRVGDILAGIGQLSMTTTKDDRPIPSSKLKGMIVRRSKYTKQNQWTTKRQAIVLRRQKSKKNQVISDFEGCTGLGAFLLKPQQILNRTVGLEHEPIKRFVSPLDESTKKTIFSLTRQVRTLAGSAPEKQPDSKSPESTAEVTPPEPDDEPTLITVSIPSSNGSTRSAIAPSLIKGEGVTDSPSSIQVPLGSKIKLDPLLYEFELPRPDAPCDRSGGELPRTSNAVTNSNAMLSGPIHDVPQPMETKLEITGCFLSTIGDDCGIEKDCSTPTPTPTLPNSAESRYELGVGSENVVRLRRSKRHLTRSIRQVENESEAYERNDDVNVGKDECKSPYETTCVSGRSCRGRNCVRRSKRLRSHPYEKISHHLGGQPVNKSRDRKAKARPLVSGASERLRQSLASKDRVKSMGGETPGEALRAIVIPNTSGISQGLHCVDGSEDDIFNATPMRRHVPSCDPTPLLPGVEPGRRSERKSVRPERYGVQNDLVIRKSDKPGGVTVLSKRSLVSRSKSSKKEVRTSSGSLSMGGKHDEVDESPDHWKPTELQALRLAQKSVDPKSLSFWDDVSELVSEKTAAECREKWFSLFETPAVKQNHKVRNVKRNAKLAPLGGYTRAEDDIFNATPMRSILVNGDDDDDRYSGGGFEELIYIARMNIGSAIKVNTRKADNGTNCGESSSESIESTKPLYKTYIQNMRRHMHRQSPKRRRCVGPQQAQLLGLKGKKIAVRSEEGGIEVDGRISPGGTLRINTIDDNDEDYFYEHIDRDEYD
jgi:hypothetical protein